MTCETKSPTIGTKPIAFPRYDNAARTIESPMVAPTPQAMPPRKLFTMIFVLEL